LRATVRLYDRLFNTANPETDAQGNDVDYRANLNPDSEIVLNTAVMESSLAHATAEQTFQFERLGYFTVDRIDAKVGAPVFNRTVGLRDQWTK
jgi:glutaminyl-tRNA synthetase